MTSAGPVAVAAARMNASISPPGAKTTWACASASDSLRTVCAAPPGIGTTAPAGARDPAHRAAVLAVDRELAAVDAVELGRRVAVQPGRTAAGRHRDLDGEQRAARVGAGRAHDDLLGADADRLAAPAAVSVLDIGSSGMVRQGACPK